MKNNKIKFNYWLKSTKRLIYPDTTIIKLLYSNNLINCKNKKILEIGCGYCSNLIIFNKKNKLFGLDFNKKLKSKIPRHIKFIHSSFEQPIIENSFFLVIDRHSLICSSDKSIFLEGIDNIYSSLAKGGYFLFSYHKNMKSVKNWTNREYIKVNKKYLEYIFKRFKLIDKVELSMVYKKLIYKPVYLLLKKK